jgi:CRISPR/Cas system-associated endonuclease Cas3-HD
MTITTYDIFQYTKDLKKAGEKDDIIEVHAKFAESHVNYLDNNIVKKNDLKLEIELVRKDIKIIEERIVNTDKNINKWGWIIMLAIAFLGLLIQLHT